MKARNIVRKFGSKAAAVGTLAMGSAMSVYAEVPADVTAAIDQGKSDSTTLGYAALGVIIGIAVIKWMRRAV